MIFVIYTIKFNLVDAVCVLVHVVLGFIIINYYLLLYIFVHVPYP